MGGGDEEEEMEEEIDREAAADERGDGEGGEKVFVLELRSFVQV